MQQVKNWDGFVCVVDGANKLANVGEPAEKDVLRRCMYSFRVHE